MRKLILAAAVAAALSAQAEPQLKICTGEYALCAASASRPTNRAITVNGVDFPERVAECPILRGPAIADVNGGNMKGSCASGGPEQVWSLFAVREKIPQAPSWKYAPAPYRSGVTTAQNGIANMFSFTCYRAKRHGAVHTAYCYGPENENLKGAVVPVGTKFMTQAPTSSLYPVGGPLP